MAWWTWMVGGAILLGAELAFVDAQFYLVFLGSAAIATGIATGALADLASWAQWALFAALAAGSMVGFRRPVYERFRGNAPGFASGPQGTVLELAQPLAAGASCQVEHGGTYWTILNDGPDPLAQGTRVRVDRVDGLVLRVRAAA